MRRRQIQFDKKDEPFRSDVRELGTLVGDMLREQGGDVLFEAVEGARRAAIRRREDPDITDAELEARLSNLPPDSAGALVRAFSTWFHMVNLAERIHRIRRRRDYLRADAGPQPESISHSLEVLREGGLTTEQIVEMLEDTRIEPVFTAHPTEAMRRTVLEKQQRMARHLVAHMDPTLTPQESHALMAQVRGELTTYWQTEEHPSTRITVAQERENALFYVTHVLYRIVPAFYEELNAALNRDREPGVDAIDRPPTILRFASWVGGDMDGNPNVDASTIRASLQRHRHLILRRYLEDVEQLFWRLSQSDKLVTFSRPMLERLRHYKAVFAGKVDAPNSRYEDMLYRLFLRLVHARLQLTEEDGADAYASADEFLSDIQLVADSLTENLGENAGLFSVRRLLRRIETFGFHLATLDVRQDSLVHRQAIAVGLGREDWMTLSATERAQALSDALEKGTPCAASDDPVLVSSVDVFRAIAECRKRYGAEAIGPYIISMAQQPDDVLSVMLLAHWGGLVDDDGHVPLDIAPLFETVDDLQNGASVMDALIEDPLYGRHVESRGRRQTIMIGYSDSNKDGGIAAARWALQEGQTALVRTLTDHDVKVVFFHGRGGTASRGGGKVHDAVLASPRNSVQNRLRVTEQGEIINAKYGLRGLAARTLEQATSAVLLASTPRPTTPRPPAWQEAMVHIAAASRRVYRASVYEADGFTGYFRQSTPIDVIERMSIGSRPSSRRKGGGVENLRAIPWVFAWTQSRQIIPGWYGVGSAFDSAAAEFGEDVLHDMTANWKFFGNMVGDVEMVLAKADMEIASRYAALADESLRHFFDAIADEFERTEAWMRRLKRSEYLLDSDPTLQRAILLRNPYVDPLSLIQVDLLKRWRETGRRDDELLETLIGSVNGIAQGLQNTG